MAEDIEIHEEPLRLNRPDEVVVRMYGQGFGDCFLLAFPRAVGDGQEPDTNSPIYVVIDSGLFFQTPGERGRMRAVARSIKAATGGTVDLLIATHEHHDHLSGFEHAKAVWKEIAVRRIWVGWTEDATHPATERYDHEQEALERQAAAARKVAEAHREKDLALAQGLLRAIALTGFAGDDVEDDDVETDDAMLGANGTGSGVLNRGPRKVSKTPHAILSDFTREPGKRFKPDVIPTGRDFCEPGQVRTVPGTSVDAYVLGPPTDEALLGLDFLESEVYAQGSGHGDSGSTHGMDAPLSWERFALATASDRAERQSVGSALERHAELAAGGNEGNLSDPDQNAPFPYTLSIPYADAREEEFFQQHYFDVERGRQIETEWLRGVGRLALQLDNLTNNTSLALAFRLPDGRVLLFVGDAQVGNWLSWQKIEPNDWRRPDGGDVAYRPTAADLLAKTVVYKVGHHGSHNATLKTKGLELMPDGLIAFVPASRRIPQMDNNPEWTIPLPSLIHRLRDKSGGRVIFPHEDRKSTSDAFAGQVEIATDTLPAMERENKETGQKEVIEEPVPLWRQVRI